MQHKSCDIVRKVHMLTQFIPDKDGFHFQNDFKNDFIPALDIHTNGLCGGMSYSALDYFYSKIPIPQQQFRPANGTKLHSYLYNRQATSILSNVDKWTEIGFNPFGTRDTEFFNWGLSAKKGERIAELQELIDSGRPAVLGLQGDGSTGNHQVVAFGYEMGNYKGDLGPHKEDFKIFVCDPNYPNKTRRLIPDVAREIYHYKEGGSETWRTYFVDKNYHTQFPPTLQNSSYPEDGLTYELILDFFTGDDDLRGGEDNVDLVVNQTDGTQNVYYNINRGARWIANNDESAEVTLLNPVRQTNIKSLVISPTFRGGLGGDNWNMKALDVYALGGGFYRRAIRVGSKRFTGEDKTLTVAISDVPTPKGYANKLWFTFKTGSDDLRGVNDNVNIAIYFRDGQTQRINDANGGKPWRPNTTQEVDVELNRAVPLSSIERIDIQTTFGGGLAGDNWDMSSLSVRATGNSIDQVLTSTGFKRFTGNDKSLSIPIVLAGHGEVNKLQLTIITGGDDLRGENDNLNVRLRFQDGGQQFVANVNGGNHWDNGTTNVVTVSLDRAIKAQNIVELDLETTFSGGIGGDNWDLLSLNGEAIGDGVKKLIFMSLFKRFTGNDKVLRIKNLYQPD
jgi:hypothetical protein